MPRSKSIILSAADKKTLLVDLKNQLKSAKENLKSSQANQKADLKLLNGAIKEAETALTNATKVHAKTVAAAEKEANRLAAEIEQLKAA